MWEIKTNCLHNLLSSCLCQDEVCVMIQCQAVLYRSSRFYCWIMLVSRPTGFKNKNVRAYSPRCGIIIHKNTQ